KPVGDPLHGPVVDVPVRHLPFFRIQRFFPHGITVVLRRNPDTPRRALPHRVVAPAVTVEEPFRIPAQGEGQQLVSQTDAQSGDLPEERCPFRKKGCQRLGIPRSVGEEQPVRFHLPNFCRVPVIGNHRHGKSPSTQGAEKGSPGPQIDHHDVGSPLPAGIMAGLFRRRPAHPLQGSRIGPIPEGRTGRGGDHPPHQPLVPDPLHHSPGIDPHDPRHSLLSQPFGQGAPRAVIHLAHHHAGTKRARTFALLRIHTAIADQRIGKGDHLTRVGGIGQGFLVSGHAGGEDQLTLGLDRPTQPPAREHLPRIQDQIRPHPPVTSRSDTASTKMLTARSTISPVTISGGRRRTTRGPAGSTSNPRSRARWITGVASIVNSIPTINPRPRTPFTQGRFPSPSRRETSRRSPCSRTFFSSSGRRISSNTDRAAAIASGFPPKVLAWLPGPNTEMSSRRAIMAPTGMPLPSPLARVTTSGTTPYCSKANSE